jgi:hypothetical protein
MREVEAEKPAPASFDPQILGARPVADDNDVITAWVLELCVGTHEGELYTEFYVLRSRGKIYVPYPTFWLNRTIITETTNGGQYTSSPGPTRREC